MVFQMLFSQKSESSYHLDRSRAISQFLKIKGSRPSLCVDGMQSIICILENCYLAARHRPFRVKMTQEPDGIASRAQPAVAAPAGRPNGRLELELVAAFKKQSLLPPWIDSSCLWSDSTKACMQFSGRRRLCRRELVVATAGGGGSRWRRQPVAAAAAWCAVYRSLPAFVAAATRRSVLLSRRDRHLALPGLLSSVLRLVIHQS